MSLIIGYDFWGSDGHQDDSTSLVNTKYAEFGHSIIDDISIRSKTNQGLSNIKDANWYNDSTLWARFNNTLEAGNIEQDGVKIVKFKIVRRLANQSQADDIYLGEVPFDSGTNADLEFLDLTNPNSRLTYSIIPVAENGLDGSPRETEVDSTDSFTGWWIVDRDTGNTLSFDKAIGSVGMVEGTLNQDRVVLDTFNTYGQVYYGQKNYESFSLSTVILPDEWKRTDEKYQEILDQFILNHKPMIVKSDNGRIFVCDVSNPRTSVPLNSWENHDYIQLTVDLVEIDSYENYMKNS